MSRREQLNHLIESADGLASVKRKRKQCPPLLKQQGTFKAARADTTSIQREALTTRYAHKGGESLCMPAHAPRPSLHAFIESTQLAQGATHLDMSAKTFETDTRSLQDDADTAVPRITLPQACEPEASATRLPIDTGSIWHDEVERHAYNKTHAGDCIEAGTFVDLCNDMPWTPRPGWLADAQDAPPALSKSIPSNGTFTPSPGPLTPTAALLNRSSHRIIFAEEIDALDWPAAASMYNVNQVQCDNNDSDEEIHLDWFTSAASRGTLDPTMPQSVGAGREFPAFTCVPEALPSYWLTGSFGPLSSPRLPDIGSLPSPWLFDDFEPAPSPSPSLNQAGASTLAEHMPTAEEGGDWQAGCFESLETLVEKLRLDELADRRIWDLEQELATCRARIACLKRRYEYHRGPGSLSDACDELWKPASKPASVVHGLWTGRQARRRHETKFYWQEANALHANITPRSRRRWRRSASNTPSARRNTAPVPPDPSFYRFTDPCASQDSSPVPNSIRISRRRLFEANQTASPVTALDVSWSSSTTIQDIAVQPKRLPRSKKHLARRSTLPRTMDFALSHLDRFVKPMNLPALKTYVVPNPPVPDDRTVRPTPRMNPHLSKRLPFAPARRQCQTLKIAISQPCTKVFDGQDVASHRLPPKKITPKQPSPFARVSPSVSRPCIKNDVLDVQQRSPKMHKRTAPSKILSASAEKTRLGETTTPENSSSRPGAKSESLAQRLRKESPLQEQCANSLGSAAKTVRKRMPALPSFTTVRRTQSPLTAGRLSMTPIGSPPASVERRDA
jgi:hypothetical protein